MLHTNIYLHNKNTKKFTTIVDAVETSTLDNIEQVIIYNNRKSVRFPDGFLEYIDESDFNLDNKLVEDVKLYIRSDSYRVIVKTDGTVYYGDVNGGKVYETAIASDTNIIDALCSDDAIYILTPKSIYSCQGSFIEHKLPLNFSSATKFVMNENYIFIVRDKDVIQLTHECSFLDKIPLADIKGLDIFGGYLYLIDINTLYKLEIETLQVVETLPIGTNNMDIVVLPDETIRILDSGNKLHAIMEMTYLETQDLSASYDKLLIDKQNKSILEFMDGVDLIQVEDSENPGVTHLYCYSEDKKTYVILEEWQYNTFYYKGDKVIHDAKIWTCLNSHNAYSTNFDDTRESWIYVSDIDISKRIYDVVPSREISNKVRSCIMRSGHTTLPTYVVPNKITDYNRTERAIPHDIGQQFDAVTVYPTEDTEGKLGDIWVRSDEENVYVGALGNYEGDLAWYGIINAEKVNPSNAIGISWVSPENGLNGWEYIDSAGRILTDNEATEIISTLDIFKFQDQKIGDNFFVEFNAGGIKAYTNNDGKFCLIVSDKSAINNTSVNSKKNFIRHPAFWNYSTGDKIDKFLMGKYKSSGAVGSAATSIPDVMPVSTIDLENFYTTCSNVGIGYHCQNFYERYWISTLMLIAAKGNIPNKFGVSDYYSTIHKNGTSENSVFGLYDFYSNCPEWIDGIARSENNPEMISLAVPGTVSWNITSSNRTNCEDAGFGFDNGSYHNSVLDFTLETHGFNSNILLIGETKGNREQCYIEERQYCNTMDAFVVEGFTSGEKIEDDTQAEIYGPFEIGSIGNYGINGTPTIGGRLAKW